MTEWAWDYFSEVKGDQVLDRFSQEDIDGAKTAANRRRKPSTPTTRRRSCRNADSAALVFAEPAVTCVIAD
jgi:hypothetical protein